MFQDNLKALRKKKGFTQEELAARLNVVRQTVSKWEKGLSFPDSELLIKLAEILEVPLSQLLGSKLKRKNSRMLWQNSFPESTSSLRSKTDGQKEFGKLTAY